MKRIFELVATLTIILFPYMLNSAEITNRLVLENSNGDTFNNCIFGIRDNATPGIDTEYGEFEFPNFAPGELQGAFYINDFTLSYKDFRGPDDSDPEINFYSEIYKLGTVFGADTIFIKWNLQTEYIKSAIIRDAIDGSILYVDMLENEEIAVSNEFIDKFIIMVEYLKIPNDIDDSYEDDNFEKPIIVKNYLPLENTDSYNTIQVFDILGNRLGSSEININNNYLDISNLKAGLYIIFVNDSEGNNKKSVFIKE